jgi:hypothetical protein
MTDQSDVVRLFERANPVQNPADQPVAPPPSTIRRRGEQAIVTAVTDAPSDLHAPNTVQPRWRAYAAIAAVATVVVGGLVLLTTGADDEQPADQPVVTTPATTTVPTTTTAPTTSADQPGWTGGLLDDLDAESLQALDSFAEGDVIVPTGPNGWRVFASGAASPEDDSIVRSQVTIIEAQPVTIPLEPAPADGQPTDPAGQRIILTLTRDPECEDTRGCSPSGPQVTINGVEWQSFSAQDQPDAVPYSGVRGSVGDLWVWVTAPAITMYETSDGDMIEFGGFDDTLLDEPTIVEFLEGLRVGSQEELAAVGTACWNCDADVVGSPDDGTEMVQLGGLDSQSLRPLALVAAGDVLIPTAPSGWYLGTTLYGDAENDDLPVSVFSVATDPSGRRSLELYLAPACDANETSCPMADNGYQIGWPVADEMVLGGVAWGYPGGRPGGAVVAVIGDHVVAIAGTWYESRTPLLNDPDVLTLLEGLRVTSLAELPEQLRVVDEFGRPIDPITGELPAPPEKQAVASAEVRGTTVVLNAAPVDDEVCMSLDRADTGETVWTSGCFVPSDVDETFVIDLAQLAAGPNFNQLAPGEELEYLLVGYIDVQFAVDVRASSDGVSVGGRSAEPTDLLDGVFVLMSVNELDDVIDFEGGFNSDTIELEVIEPSD